MEIPEFEKIISVDNLLLAWQEFLRGKRKRRDVQEFQHHLMDNILNLHIDLKNKMYVHDPYHAFNISDPKPRNIHKAKVRDRLLHHAIYRVLYPYFDRKFISDSYSCRKWKGTHKAMEKFKEHGRKVSRNNTKQCFILKCDVRKFFASIDQEILLNILKSHNLDQNTLWLLERVIGSFHSTEQGKGLPLGNLTSQLLVNIYMNNFDQYVKHTVKVKHYIRYADDFVIFSTNRDELLHIVRYIELYLIQELKLTLHPDKIFINTLSSGVDFLGWIHFPHHRVLRTTTKRRMVRRIKENPNRETMQSYVGMLSWGNGYEISQKINSVKFSSNNSF